MPNIQALAADLQKTTGKKQKSTGFSLLPATHFVTPSNASDAAYKEDQKLQRSKKNLFERAKRSKHPLLMKALRKGLKPNADFTKVLRRSGTNSTKTLKSKNKRQEENFEKIDEAYTIITILPKISSGDSFHFTEEIEIVCRNYRIPGRRTFVLSSLEEITVLK